MSKIKTELNEEKNKAGQCSTVYMLIVLISSTRISTSCTFVSLLVSQSRNICYGSIFVLV